ncbi:phd zinc finger-containing protein [Stylonychia lemnae]|uniref:Phd zinc finger-containing protein n=1 Tax=Stylonychia lemnae TaxID=5949 RepID=A0A078B2B7_STYLE|nr:phd zinc finger-containing protein [Stylonychia lemnae]|eukprot:CDW88690.1 phd zinc finger-containing protein [Stylonychia lemnae]
MQSQYIEQQQLLPQQQSNFMMPNGQAQYQLPQQQMMGQQQIPQMQMNGQVNPFLQQQMMFQNQMQQQQQFQQQQNPIQNGIQQQNLQTPLQNQYIQQQYPIQNQMPVLNLQQNNQQPLSSTDYNGQQQQLSVQQAQKQQAMVIDTSTNDGNRELANKSKNKQDKKKPQTKEESLVSSLDQSILYSKDHKTRYSYIYETKNDKDEDIMCDVCQDDYVEEGTNELIICELCNSAVHMQCYGNEIFNYFPQEAWYCMRCQFLRNNPESTVAQICCQFCNDLKGIIIRDQRNIWAHITCVNWIPDVWYKDDYKTLIEGNFNNDRQKLNCYVCRKKNTGSCIQCDYKNCQQAFHVRCGMKTQLIRDWESMDDQRVNEDDYECFVFCDKHLEIGKRDLKTGGKDRLRETGLKCQIDEKLKKFGLTGNSLKKGKKKTEQKIRDDTYVAGKDSQDQDEYDEEQPEEDDDLEADPEEDENKNRKSRSRSRFNGRRSKKPQSKCKGIRVQNNFRNTRNSGQNSNTAQANPAMPMMFGNPQQQAMILMMQQMIAMQQQQQQQPQQPPILIKV